MDHLFAARAQMGTSLGFHFIFSSLGIGLPLLLVVLEGLWLKSGDDAYYRLARTWAKAMAVLFAVGAVSGTALSFELGLLWPEFMRYAGSIIGIPFSAEGFAFFIEAIFVGIYLYGWKKLSPLAHWLCGIPIAISGALSGVFVVSANAWMNTPTGFRVVHGRVTDVQPFVAMFNPAFPTEAMHTLLAAYVFVGFAVAAVYAFALLKQPDSAYHRAGLRVGMLVAAIAIPLQLIVGDFSARFDAEHEPIKLAALEGQFQTQQGAPLRIGGWPNDASGTTVGALEIPKMLSFLAYGNPDATVRGIKSFPADDVPKTLPIHLSFQAMVASGSLLLLIAAAWAYLTRFGQRASSHRLLQAIVVAGPLGFIAMEAGWMVTEEGRQPWIVHGFLRTRDAVTTAPGLDITFYGFSLMYVLLAATLVWLLLRIGRGHDDEEAGTH
jgi:cytochrome d ubiquinol oxidase subunit I